MDNIFVNNKKKAFLFELYFYCNGVMKQIKKNNKNIVASDKWIRSTFIEKENWFSHPCYCKIDNGDNALLPPLRRSNKS